MSGREQIKAFFGQHAAAYRQSPGQGAGRDLERLVSLLAPAGSERLLDVATATGNTALALAPLVRDVTGLDLTPEMEREFTMAARRRRVTNARFVLGDAESLPFPDATFDLVTCRRAAHHFPSIPRAVAEMVRVLRPGGKLGLVDMAAPDEPQAARLFNAMEAARDPSHQRALSPAEWHHVLAATGLQVEALAIEAEELPFARWLYPVAADGAEAAAAAALARAATPEAAASVVYQDAAGELMVRKRRVILTAHRIIPDHPPGAAVRRP